MNALIFIFYALAIFLAIFSLAAAVIVGLGLIVILLIKVPYVPTPAKNVRLIIEALNLRPGQIFYDLGCGDGRYLIAAADKQAKAIGFEISPQAYLLGRFNLWQRQSPAKIYFKNFYGRNLADADAVVCFLMDTVMAKVEKKLNAELKPGAKVACYGFKLPNWKEEKIVYLDPQTTKKSRLYLYIKQ
jgi:SAM-dependent methyltransferase